MKLTLASFKGIAPKFDPEQLADDYSVQSLNARSGREILESWQNPLAAVGGALSSALVKSLFKYNTKWFSWTKSGVTAVRVPLANDPWDYVVIADPLTYPQMTFNTVAESGVGPWPATTFRLGVNAPVAPTIVQSKLLALPEGVVEDDFDSYETSYVVVFIDAFGRASAPSPASANVIFKEYEGEEVWFVDVTMPNVPTNGVATNASRGTTGKWYVYRGNFNGGGSGLYQYTGTVSAGTANPVFRDKKPSLLLDESPSTYDWTPAPDDNVAMYPNGPLQKVVAMVDFLAGHNSKLVCFSEPAAFHAWPTAYYQVFSEKVITIIPSGQNLVVLTDSNPYVVTGAAPSAMSPVKLAEPAACASSLAVTEVADRIYFASNDGMMEINGFTVRNVSRDYMTEIQWRALSPSTMTFSNYGGFVLIHCALTNTSYVYDPSAPNDAFRQLNINPQATYQLTQSSDMAYVAKGSSTVVLFNSDSVNVMPLTWQSKVYQFNDPVCMSVAKVSANKYPVSVKFSYKRVDETVESYTKTVTDDRFFYLPFQNRGYRWWAEVIGSTNSQIRTIQIGQSAQEFN